jgi:uncharacterized protein YjbI with pentapeptide repeats
MLKKNWKLFSFFFILNLLFFVNSYASISWSSSSDSGKNIVYGDTIVYAGIDSVYFNAKTFKNCFFNFTLSENYNFENVKFYDDTFTDMDFMKCNIQNVSFTNCSFKEIRITNARNLNNLFFYNTRIEKIVIDQSTFKSIHISSLGNDTISLVLIQNCNKSNGIIFSGNFKKIVLEGGQISDLDITNITNSDCFLSVISTYLQNPNLFSTESKQPQVFFHASLENTQFDISEESILSEELEIDNLSSRDSYSTDRTAINKKYMAVRTAYNHLTKVFNDQKNYDLSDYFEYRSKVCDRKITTSRFDSLVSWIFNEKMRGNYGTNSFVVLMTMLIILFLFSFLYFILGIYPFKFAFGFYLNTKLSGEIVEDERPVLITLRHSLNGFIDYATHCFLFSLNQMILGGISRGFHIHDFSLWYLFPPRKYGSIGIGRIISFVQNIIGLMMLFFFITAFLKLNR